MAEYPDYGSSPWWAELKTYIDESAGEPGNGIADISLHSTDGLEKTYRITMEDASFYDFVVTDGEGIAGIALFSTTGTNPVVKTYRITYDSGATFDYTVSDGTQGGAGDTGPPGSQITSGSGAPDNSYGEDTDYYIDNDGLTLYGPKAGGVWPAGVPMGFRTVVAAYGSYDPDALAVNEILAEY